MPQNNLSVSYVHAVFQSSPLPINHIAITADGDEGGNPHCLMDWIKADVHFDFWINRIQEALQSTGQGNYILEHGGELLDEVPSPEIQDVANFLYRRLVESDEPKPTSKKARGES